MFVRRDVLNPRLSMVVRSNYQEAFLGAILLTVLSMSFMTERLGLNNTLGAFLVFFLLSEIKYRYHVEANIALFRKILIELLFVMAGFEIDLYLISSKLSMVASIVTRIILSRR